MTQVKICGIRRIDDARVAVERGAAMLGFVFYERSKRLIDPLQAAEIVAAAREVGAFKAVGVFVNETAQRMNEVAHIAGLDYVQLSGDEPDSVVEAVHVPAIQVVHVGEEDADVLADRIHRTPAQLVLLDTPSATYGGTGRRFPWSRLPALERPYMLAGGLDARNVAEAIHGVGPWGVDVSSGVERDGVKDANRIRAFMEAVHAADAAEAMERE